MHTHTHKSVLFQRELGRQYSLPSVRAHYLGYAIKTDLWELAKKWRYEEKHSDKTYLFITLSVCGIAIFHWNLTVRGYIFILIGVSTSLHFT